MRIEAGNTAMAQTEGWRYDDIDLTDHPVPQSQPPEDQPDTEEYSTPPSPSKEDGTA